MAHSTVDCTNALHHHANAKTALEKGDAKAAAHHLGHAMNALKQAKPKTDGGMTLKQGQAAYMGNIRKAIKK